MPKANAENTNLRKTKHAKAAGAANPSRARIGAQILRCSQSLPPQWGALRMSEFIARMDGRLTYKALIQ